MAAFGLPEEVWLYVFEFLSSSDKLRVRSSCRLFKRLVDRPSLWRNSTVYLDKIITSYESYFWRTLRNRKTSSAVVLKAGSETEWTMLASRLPGLVSLTVHMCCDHKALAAFSRCIKLKKLVIHQCRCPSLAASLTSLLHLTHISLCEVISAPRSDIINGLSQLTNLTSLYYHDAQKPLTKEDLHNILQCLPNLKRLSLNMGANLGRLPNDYLCLTNANQMPGLTSLELLNYVDPILSPVALQGVPYLKRLTVQYRNSPKDSTLCHLKTWLSMLPLLSELSISSGCPLDVYANSVPRTVQSLTLKGVIATIKAMRKIAEQVPDLSLLHFDVFCHERHSLISEIPLLFFKLKCLKIRHHNVPESEFLQLAQMSHLKRLVVLDSCKDHSSAQVIQKLHIQTNYRIHVSYSSEIKDQNACHCAY